MNIGRFLSRLRQLNVKLWVEGDRLRYIAPTGAMTPDIRDELVRHKAQVVDALRQVKPTLFGDTSPITPVPRERLLPLSYAQQRLWLLTQFEPDSPAYNMFCAIRMTGRIDRDALGRSLTELVRRHEVLRTTFSTVGDLPHQVIASDLTMRLPLVDLTHLESQQRDAELDHRIHTEILLPFDVATDSLVRASLFGLEPTEHVLLLTIHHLVCDGWSMGVLFRELTALYGAFSKGKPSPLAPLPIQYADFAVWQRKGLQSSTRTIRTTTI